MGQEGTLIQHKLRFVLLKGILFLKWQTISQPTCETAVKDTEALPTWPNH